MHPAHGDDVSTLLRRADLALYQSKRDGGAVVYAHGEDAHALDRPRMVEELRDALATRQFLLHYQPKMDLRTDLVHGVEALVRWAHPTRGLLYPDQFLAVVEDVGLMAALTGQVLQQALDQAADWRSAGLELAVAVNLSASSLLDMNLPDQVAGLLSARQLPAETLQLEITEELVLVDRARARDILDRLRRHGVRISIDDFGTGYSSLAYLRELPVDELKLDRSFVTPMTGDPRAAALVSSTIALAHSLGLRLVAEGVEDEFALRELARFGCDEAQGFYLSRPMAAVDVPAWLREQVRSTRSCAGSPTGSGG
jgi:EAL domain-containing protein (putative c-di-GMP-specific phosphodiesterase class I)